MVTSNTSSPATARVIGSLSVVNRRGLSTRLHAAVQSACERVQLAPDVNIDVPTSLNVRVPAQELGRFITGFLEQCVLNHGPFSRVSVRGMRGEGIVQLLIEAQFCRPQREHALDRETSMENGSVCVSTRGIIARLSFDDANWNCFLDNT